jgi:hypothetical protein
LLGEIPSKISPHQEQRDKIISHSCEVTKADRGTIPVQKGPPAPKDEGSGSTTILGKGGGLY